jgi:hypothetical protein
VNAKDRPLAKVIANIPASRVFSYEKNGRLPIVGEVGEFDHSHTAEPGVTLHGVYVLDDAGKEVWSADLLESEFVVVQRPPAGT